MSEKKSALPKLELGSWKQAWPLLVMLLLLLSAWLLWGGFKQWQSERLAKTVLVERDLLAEKIGKAVTDLRKQVEKAATGDEAKAALAAGDGEALAAAMRKALPKAREVRHYPPDLRALYQNPAAVGYARLAVVEEARGEQKAATRIGMAGKEKTLLVALPVAGEQTVLVAMPLQPLAAAMEAADPGNGYLALRQNDASVFEKGAQNLAYAAESEAAKIAGSTLRIAAGIPETPPGPAGLGLIASLVGGVLLLLGGLALLLLPRFAGKGTVAEEESNAAPTLDELVAGGGQAVAPLPPAAADDAAEVPAAPGPAEAPSVPVSAASAVPAAMRPGITLDPGIFRAYDIRGIVGESLDGRVARVIGQAIGSLMQEQGHTEIVVGRDGRLSGPELAGGLMEGLRDAGCRVIDIGLAPTPLVYFAAYHLRAGSCVAVTGSHNPPRYNGFKIVVGGETLSGKAITALYERIRNGQLHSAQVRGEMEEKDVNADYVLRVASDIQIARPLKVVVDAGNGAAGELGPKVLEAIGAEVTPLYCDIDGRFPNHHPDPSDPHNLEDLTQAVQRTGADLGIAFDGDGDRLGVITPAGRNIFPDRLLMLFAADVLDRQPGAAILYDVKCTGALMPWVLRHGGSPMMWKTGHSFIKVKMRETEAELAGEMSGHFFFKERWYGFDDGIYAAARLLEILAAQDDSADAVFARIPEGTSTPELKIPVSNPHAFIERFVEGGGFEGARLTTIDGLRADWPDGWGLVRASNTTPILVLRFEANDAAALKRIQEAFRARLMQLDAALEIPF